jgi:hypothetical protein
MRRLRHRRPRAGARTRVHRHPESQYVAAWPTSDGPTLSLAGVGRCGRWDAAKQASVIQHADVDGVENHLKSPHKPNCSSVTAAGASRTPPRQKSRTFSLTC